MIYLKMGSDTFPRKKVTNRSEKYYNKKKGYRAAEELEEKSNGGLSAPRE